MKKPTDLPQEKWDNMGLIARAQIITLIEKMGSYEAVKQWMTERALKSHANPKKPRKFTAEQVELIKSTPKTRTKHPDAKSDRQLAEMCGYTDRQTIEYVNKIRNGHRL